MPPLLEESWINYERLDDFEYGSIGEGPSRLVIKIPPMGSLLLHQVVRNAWTYASTGKDPTRQLWELSPEEREEALDNLARFATSKPDPNAPVIYDPWEAGEAVVKLNFQGQDVEIGYKSFYDEERKARYYHVGIIASPGLDFEVQQRFDEMMRKYRFIEAPLVPV